MRDPILRKVANKPHGIIHAVIAEWTGSAACGIEIKKHWVEYDRPITCLRCLNQMK